MAAKSWEACRARTHELASTPMSDQTLTPLIGVPADLRHIDGMPFHAVFREALR